MKVGYVIVIMLSIVIIASWMFGTSTAGTCGGQAWKKMNITSRRLLGEYKTSGVRSIWACSTDCTDDQECQSFGFDVVKSICLHYAHLVWAGGMVDADVEKGINFHYYWKHKRRCIPTYSNETNGRICSKGFTETKNWTDAMKECTKDGGHLAMLDTNAKYEYFIEMAQTNGLNYIYLGSINENKDSQWVWLNGINNDRWSTRQPNDDQQNCFLLVDGSGHDAFCHDKYQYICEVPII